MAYGERRPAPGQRGMPMSMYIHEDELALLDKLKQFWGTNRNAALRQAIRLTAESTLGNDPR